MNRNNEPAATLDELTGAAIELATFAENLTAAIARLRCILEANTGEEPKGEKKKPAARRTAESAPETPAPARPAENPELPADPPEKQYSKEEIRGMLSDLAGTGHREEAKALVHRYSGGGSFSDIDPAKYPELAEEVRKIHV